VSEWTVEQAAEVCIEQLLYLLDGCDDEDTVRPALVFAAVAQAWAPQIADEFDPLDCTAGEFRQRLRRARQGLAEGERIP
jgi:hypothetical protein